MRGDLLAWGMVTHLVADFLLQNEWMALHKVSLRHPAAWVHAGIHGACFLLLFGHWLPALGLAATHMLIDTRWPLAAWRRLIRQTQEGPMAIHVAIWSDQAAHLACVALVVRAWSP